MRTIPREVFISIKAGFKLNDKQRDVLIGTLLGDGNIQLRKKDARLHIKHSQNQLSLVDYKRKVFKNITSMPVRIFKQRVGQTDYSFTEFVTLTHPEFTNFYNIFYLNSRKIIPKGIENILVNPLSLAIWIMDDGSAEYSGLSIQTHSFTEAEVIRLMRVIKINFNITALRRKNKGRWIIYFPKNQLSRIRSLVDKYILPEFKYKLLPYSERPRRDCTPVPR